MILTVHPYGDRALLVELADAEAVVVLTDHLRGEEAVGELVADVVPAARSVLLVARAGVAVERLRGVVPDEKHHISPGSGAFRQGLPPVAIPVTYDGPDLAEVAELTGLSDSEVVEAHVGSEWRVAFGGFAPGFAYLVGGDTRLQVPRRETPRTRVPAGSVGLAGEFSGIYPRESPGGWRLIGRTDAVLWDLARDEPALLTAGATVRFEAVDG
ncbi:MAG: allophanate hydrolase subunit 1 [Nocardioidaceae bacterium]|nr:allophanate hydrolase subunit 1 [Nocardioidaceae bacterium]MCL2614033.1 allophanate hydrolase subunit 1 [Nocardioidaceae bacterium]